MGSCAARGAQELIDAMRLMAKEEFALEDIRVNNAGCLGRCDKGPVLVVYPDAVWYTFVDEHDIDEIVDSHLRDGRPVERLKLE